MRYDEHLTPEKLDAMDFKNPTHVHILGDQVESLIKNMGLFFSKNITREAQVAIAKKLVEAGYRFTAIKRGLNQIIETSQSYPTYSEIVASIRPFMPQYGVSEFTNKRFEQEKQRHDKLRTEFINMLGEETLNKYVEWWLKNIPEINIKESKTYEKCALFDWDDAGKSNNFEKIKTIGKNKLLSLK